MSNKRNRFNTTFAFVDIFFNVLLVFMIVTACLMLLIKHTESTGKIDDKNELIIKLEWDPGTSDDVDLWVADPSGAKVWYSSKEAPGMVLQRDDIGSINDTLKSPEGVISTNPLNQEIVNIRVMQPGVYTVNVHAFKIGQPVKARVQLVKVNPYQEFAPVELELQKTRDWEAPFSFELAPNGSVKAVTPGGDHIIGRAAPSVGN